MPPTPNSEDARWFAQEVQPHESELKAYLRRQFPGGEVDDVVQESYLRVLRHPERSAIRSVRAYLFTTARNLVLAGLRRPRIFSATPVTEPAATRIVEENTDVVERVSTDQEIALLLEAVDALPRRCREIFILRKLQGLPQKEIATRLGLSEQTVQVQIARGAAKCAAYLRARGVTGRFG